MTAYRDQFPDGWAFQTRGAWGAMPSRPPVVWRVTDWADTLAFQVNADGTRSGTLRAAVLAQEPRVIVPEVSGEITLNDALWPLGDAYAYFTLAAQAAPSPGLTIRMAPGFGVDRSLYCGTHDAVWQHIRIRPGESCNSGFQSYYDFGAPATHHIVLDHMSVSWAEDEGVAVYLSSRDFGMWRTIVAENLAYTPGGELCGGGGAAWNGIGVGTSPRVALLQNLWAHNGNRNPQIGQGSSGAMHNTVVYEPWEGPLWLSFDNSPWYWSVRGMYMRRGTRDSSGGGGGSFSVVNTPPGSQLFLDDYVLDNSGVPANWRDYAVFPDPGGYDPRVFSEPAAATLPGYTPLSAAATFDHVLRVAGARPADRDAVDARIVAEVRDRTGNWVSTSIQAGGYPVLARNRRVFNMPANPNSVAPGQESTGRTVLQQYLDDLALSVEGLIVPAPLILLNAAVLARALSSADLLTPPPGASLGASIQAQAAMSGGLFVPARAEILSAAILAKALVAADLLTPLQSVPPLLAGGMLGQAALAGDLTTAISLTGALTATGTVDGDLFTTLRSAAELVSGAFANVTVSGSLTTPSRRGKGKTSDGTPRNRRKPKITSVKRG